MFSGFRTDNLLHLASNPCADCARRPLECAQEISVNKEEKRCDSQEADADKRCDKCRDKRRDKQEAGAGRAKLIGRDTWLRYLAANISQNTFSFILGDKVYTMSKFTPLVVLQTLAFVAIVSAAISFVPNKSNFPTAVMCALIASILTKYVLGDWDEGYTYTATDIIYWGSIGTVGYLAATAAL